MEQNIIAVSQVNEYIKFLLDRDELLTNLCVRGEVSNYKIYPSGHHYFTLKDAEGALKCVMFRSSAQRLRFRPENGMQVIAYGRVTVFPRDGAYHLYCSALTADGAGDLYVAFEQLKEKLSREGLFDPAHKKPLPRYPHTIAIITSAAGAAIMDMLRILAKRYPLAKIKLLPGCDPLREPLSGCRPDHHRTRRRLHGGSLGLQRRARGAGDLCFRDPGHFRCRP